MVRAASRCFFLSTNLVISIRLEELLVRGALSNPVRKNRGLIGVAKPSGGCQPWRVIKDAKDAPTRRRKRRVPKNHPGCKKAYFAGDGGSARMRSLVLRHFEQEIQAQIKIEAGRKMALKCEFCGKAPHYGNVISHANNTRRRRWNPNLKRVRAVVAGVRKQVRVCTACILAGKIKKAA